MSISNWTMKVDLSSKQREMIRIAAIDLIREVEFQQLTFPLLSQKAGVKVSLTRKLFNDEREVLLGSCIKCFSKMAGAVFQPSLNYSMFNQGLQTVWLNYQLFNMRYPREAMFVQQFLRMPSALHVEGAREDIRQLMRPFIDFLSGYKRNAISDVQALMIIFLLGNYAVRDEASGNDLDIEEAKQLFSAVLLPKIERILSLPFYNIAT